MQQRTRVVLTAVLTVVVLAGLTACEYRRGPDPTRASLEATAGPFAITSVTVPAGNGFGGGTIYYPTDTTPGRYGGVAVVPGYTALQSSISWYGPRVASQGFVVITIDTNTTTDPPNSRGTQLLAALDYLTTTSPVADRVDKARLAVMGWSMGGGGTLFASKSRPSLKAAIPLAPFSGQLSFPTVTVPTLFIACQSDTIAPVASYAKPLYASLPATNKKAYVEIAGGSHYCVTTPNTSIARSVIAWLKRFVDGDTRYDPFLCPPIADPAESDHQSTCPYS